MNNLSTGTPHPTRAELLDKHWLEFLQYVKQVNHYAKASPVERDFWVWYINNVMETPDANP